MSQPGILERDKAAGAGLVAGESLHLVEKRRVLKRDCERRPIRFRDGRVKGGGVAKFGIGLSELLPQHPAAAIAFGQVFGRVDHGAETRRIGHRRVLDEDNVVGADDDRFALAVSPKLQTGNRDLAVHASSDRDR